MEDQQKLTVRFLSEADSCYISKEIDLRLMNFGSDQIVQNAGSEVRSPFSAGDLGTGSLTSITSLNSPGFRSVWCGAAVILPRKYFNDLGGFDETFFLYYEDTEFSIRAWNQDLYPFLIPKLKVLHEHSGITGENEIERGRTINRSRILFSVRTSGSRYAILFIIFTLLRTFKLLVFRKTTLRHFLFKLMPDWHHMILGFMDGILKKPKLNGGHKL
jgi:GT2 family glycosyltransferase